MKKPENKKVGRKKSEFSQVPRKKCKNGNSFLWDFCSEHFFGGY